MLIHIILLKMLSQVTLLFLMFCTFKKLLISKGLLLWGFININTYFWWSLPEELILKRLLLA